MGLSYSSFFIQNDGTVKACGYNGNGELGLGDTVDRNTPTLITKLIDVLELVDYFTNIVINYTILSNRTEFVYYSDNKTILENITIEKLQEFAYTSIESLFNDSKTNNIKNMSIKKYICKI